MTTKYTELMSDPEFRKEMAVETLVAEASELIAQLMAEQNLSKADLARRLNKSRAWVTQVLSGKANLTVRTLAEIAHELGAEVKLKPQSQSGTSAAQDRTQWKPIAGQVQYYRLKQGSDIYRFAANLSAPSTETEVREEYVA